MSSVRRGLPHFTDNPDNAKRTATVGDSVDQPEPAFVRFLDEAPERLGLSQARIKLLDIGCNVT